MISHPYGFRIQGATSEPRRLVNAAAAFAGYCSLDERIDFNREAYLSAFQFGRDFRSHLDGTGSTREFAGECWSPWLWLDIDREGNIEQALHDARRLAACIVQCFRLDDGDVWPFFSGSKGFHIGVPTSPWNPAPATNFHRIARQFCETVAERAGVLIDVGVYDRVRAFRAPNSRHPKTGLHKLPLTLDELLKMRLEAILDRARSPLAVEIPETSGNSEQAAADWQGASEAIEQRNAAMIERKATLNRSTLEFIRDGAGMGDRHRLLFSAAANLAEFGCPFDLAFALLAEAALDSGLPPREVRRQIECGLNSAKRLAPCEST